MKTVVLYASYFSAAGYFLLTGIYAINNKIL
jgi:hypothetical protein